MSSWKDVFLQDMFQMTTTALVSVINHYHINGFHLFWNTLYLTKHFSSDHRLNKHHSENFI